MGTVDAESRSHQRVHGPDELSFVEVFAITLVLCFVYGAAHAGEIVQFYGMRAARATMSADKLKRDWVRAAKASL